MRELTSLAVYGLRLGACKTDENWMGSGRAAPSWFRTVCIFQQGASPAELALGRPSPAALLAGSVAWRNHYHWSV